MSRLLIVEDELHLADGLRFNFEAEGHTVEVVGTGEAALERLRPGHGFDAVVLDVMLPGKSGFEVAGELRAANEFVPVLMLTARGRAEDVLQGFAAGADDYVTKPFDLAVLVARLGGLLRRRAWSHTHPPPQASENGTEVFTFAGKTADFSALELRVRGRTLRLTQMEADLLRHLVRNAGKVVARRDILQQVWNLHVDTDTRAIDNFIVRLRRYIEDEPARPRHLLTVRGIGYRFLPEPPPVRPGR